MSKHRRLLPLTIIGLLISAWLCVMLRSPHVTSAMTLTTADMSASDQMIESPLRNTCQSGHVDPNFPVCPGIK